MMFNGILGVISHLALHFFVHLILWKFYKFATYKPKNFPPGPPRIPIFGSYLFLFLLNFKFLHKGIYTLLKVYKTKVIGFFHGPFPAIVTTDSKAIRELMTRSEFDGRPDIFAVRLREPDFKLKGLFFTQGSFWKEQKNFTLRHLGEYGFGKRNPKYEEEVNDELQKMVEMLKEGPKFEHEKQLMKNGSWLFPDVLLSSMGNLYLQTLLGERVPRSKQDKSLKAGRAAKGFHLVANSYGNLLSLIPWARHIFPNATGYNILRQFSMDLYDFTHDLVQKYVETYKDGEVRNFIDAYIKKIKDGQEGYTYDQLYFLAKDLLFPSMSAISLSLSSLFKILLNNPSVIKKVQSEIEEVVGSGRLPTLDDRANLPYCEATLREATRFETLVHTGLPHTVLDKEQEFMGYTLPKGTIMYPMLEHFHHDPELWDHPANFNPDRFLEGGKLNLKKDVSLPFGAGKRVCVGENFARNTLFLVYTTILQNFDLKTPDGSIPDMSKRISGLITGPEDYWLNLVAR